LHDGIVDTLGSVSLTRCVLTPFWERLEWRPAAW
jgi:hypothetical protein